MTNEPSLVKEAEQAFITESSITKRRRPIWKNLPEGSGCKFCDDPNHPVAHFGSSMCQSGGLGAEGGTRSHCTCDSCF